MTILLGIDHGGTRTKLLLVDDDNDNGDSAARVVRQETLSTLTEAASLDSLADAAADFAAPHRVDGFGVTVAGILDEATGQVHASANLPWLTGTVPAERLGARLGARGVAVHDGRAAAAAEAVLGAGRGFTDVFVLTLGTGIAGAHVVDGMPRHGAHGGAGELGHVPVGGDRACSCGQRGCLETSIGGAHLAARWIESGRGVPGSSAVDLVTAATRGDPVARAILDAATSALARGILSLVAIVDPAAIVIGGGVAEAAEWTVDPAVRKAQEAATFHRIPPVVRSGLGSWAGAWGAVLAAGGALSSRRLPPR